MSVFSARRRRMLAGGILVLALGAAGVSTSLTGAWFTSSVTTPASVTGAVLSIGEIGRASDQTTIAVADVYPMTDAQSLANAAGAQTKSEWITVRNTGTIPLDWSLQVVNPQAKSPLTASQLAMFRFQLFSEAGVQLTDPLTLGSQPPAAVPGVALASATGLAAGGQSRVQIRVWLDAAAGDEFQGAGATFDVVVNSVQAGVALPDPTGPFTPSAFSSGSCLLRADGGLYCLGENVGIAGARWSGLSTLNSATYVRTSDSGALRGRRVTSVEAGSPTACAIADSSLLACWGEYPGDGSTSSDIPVPVAGALAGKAIADVALNPYGAGACAAAVDGTVACWGNVLAGAPGANRPTALPTAVGSDNLAGDRPVSIAKSFDIGCVTTERGRLLCWGSASFGSGLVNSATLQQLDLPADAGRVIDVALDQSIACVITSRSLIYCLGLYGEPKTGAPRLYPATGLTKATRIVTVRSAGFCALGGGAVYCWGGSSRAAGLGLGSDALGWTAPTRLTGVLANNYVTGIDAGLSIRVKSSVIEDPGLCAATAAGELTCWGRTGQWTGPAAFSYNAPSAFAVLPAAVVAAG